MLIANFSKNPVKLNARKVVATADDHPYIITESNITHVELLGLTKNEYKKRDKNVRNLDTVDKHLADVKLAALRKDDDVPITSDNVEIHASKEYHPRICELLGKHEDL